MNQLPESLVHFRGELEEAIRSEQQSQATDRGTGRGTSILRPLRRRPGRMALAVAVLAGAAVAALFVGAPWKGSPGFLDRAQAALTPPDGSVLHYRWDVTQTSEDFGCTVTSGPNETWIDQTPPYRYRQVMDMALRLGALPLACGEVSTVELGGSTESLLPLVFEPPNTLTLLSPIVLEASRDPLADLREMIRDAIRDGRAHDEGQTELGGRVLERIRLDPETFGCRPHCPTRPSYAYMDPETFLPVRFERPDGLKIVPGPDGSPYYVAVVVRYLEVEYLPRTAENLALTDIRAQHPNAIGP
jgi:hypothetical protein